MLIGLLAPRPAIRPGGHTPGQETIMTLRQRFPIARSFVVFLALACGALMFAGPALAGLNGDVIKIGRASCRERVFRSV